MRLKIVTYNIKSGLYHPDGLEAIARVLEEAAPQVIALQEVDRKTRRARGVDQTAWLAERLGMPYHCFGPATPWEGGGEYGVALISSYPLLNPRVDRLWLPPGDDSRHGEREPRVALSAAVGSSGLVVLVTHLGLTDEQRLRQAEQLVELANDAGAEQLVVTGDFNGRPESAEVKVVADSLHDVLDELPEKERVTFPSGDPEMHGEDYLARTIDYIFVSASIEVESAGVIADYSLASDHNPCQATLLLPEKASSRSRPPLSPL